MRHLLLPMCLAAVLVPALPMTAFSAPVTAARLSPAPDDPDAYVIDGDYLRGEGRIAGMRARHELPDRIPDGDCSFEIAGDPGVVFYVRECP